MLHARLEPQFDSVRARLLVTFLAFSQPLVRGWTRYFTWIKYKRTPERVIRSRDEELEKGSAGRRFSKLEFWNEEGHGRERLLAETTKLLEDEGWSYSLDTGWNDWDLQVYGSLWWLVRLRTVTEYHGGPKCLTRANLQPRAAGATVIVNVLLLGILAYQQLLSDGLAWWSITGYALFLGFLWLRSRRLTRRVADLLTVGARRAGLEHLKRKKQKT